MKTNAHTIPVGLLIAVMGCLFSSAARGDGGTLWATQQVGPYRVAVFTDPTPLRAGLVDVSAWIQDAKSGEVVDDVEVNVTARNFATGRRVSAQATREMATNKLMRAARLELPTGGSWQFLVTIRSKNLTTSDDEVSLTFDVAVGERLPRWRALAWWIFWPAVPIALFAMHLAISAWQTRPYYPHPHSSPSARSFARSRA